MKPKVMDMDTDWQVIKDEYLKGLEVHELNSGSGSSGAGDFRYVNMDDDNEVLETRLATDEELDAILRALVGVASFN